MVSEIAASRQPGIRANLAAIMNFRCFRTSKVVTSGTGNKFFKSGKKSETAEDSGKQPKPPIIAAIPKRIGKEVPPNMKAGIRACTFKSTSFVLGIFYQHERCNSVQSVRHSDREARRNRNHHQLKDKICISLYKRTTAPDDDDELELQDYRQFPPTSQAAVRTEVPCIPADIQTEYLKMCYDAFFS